MLIEYTLYYIIAFGTALSYLELDKRAALFEVKAQEHTLLGICTLYPVRLLLSVISWLVALPVFLILQIIIWIRNLLFKQKISSFYIIDLFKKRDY